MAVSIRILPSSSDVTEMNSKPLGVYSLTSASMAGAASAQWPQVVEKNEARSRETLRQRDREAR